MSKVFEDFLQEISPLPLEIRRSLLLMRQLDLKKDGKSHTSL
jgi:hypothetical protein